MKYDVLFVHPQNYGNLQTYLKLPSLELCQISAVLNQNGYSNKLVDCFIDGRDIQELDNMLPIESPRIVLIYCSEYNHINALHTAYYLAQRYPKDELLTYLTSIYDVTSKEIEAEVDFTLNESVSVGLLIEKIAN